MNIFITGGTGFIGKRIVRGLCDHYETVYLLVRKKSLNKAKITFSNIENIVLVEGDLTENDILYSLDDFYKLKKEVDIIFNIAGNYNLEISELDSYIHNVIGMQNLLNFAKECINLKFIHHISTYAVAGNKSGLISEDTMDDAHNFNDYYARSKMQAESIFRNFDLPHVKKRIYRPGIVIGSMSDGKIEKIDGPYYLIKFLYEHKNLIKRLESLKVFPLPYSNKAKLPLIPVDVLTRWICHAVTNPKSDQMIRSYNFMGKELISIKDFVELVFNEFNIKTKVMRLKRVNAFKHVLPMIGMPKELLSYMYSEASLDTSNRENDYPEMQEYKIQDMAHNLIKGSTNFFEGLQ